MQRAASRAAVRGHGVPAGASWALLAAGVGAIGLYFLLPTVAAKDIAYIGFGAAGVAATTAGVVLNRPTHPTPWWWWIAGLVFYTASMVAYWYHQQVIDDLRPFPSTADVFAGLQWGAFGIGMVLAIRLRRADGDWEALLDSALITTVAAAVAWEFFLASLFSTPSSLAARMAAAAYGATAVLVLCVGVRLLFEPRGRGPSLWMLLGGLLASVVGQTTYALLSLTGAYATGHAIDAAILLLPVLWGAAALHPTCDRVTSPRHAARIATPRQRALVLGGVLVGGSLLLILGQVLTPTPSLRPVPLLTMGVFVLLLVIARVTVAERRAEIARAEALHAQRLRDLGRLAGSIAHDYNNLMTVILGVGELLREDVRDLPDVVADLDEILRAARHAATLTEQLLAFTRWQIDDLEIVDMNELVASNVGLLQRLAGERMDVHAEVAEGRLWTHLSPSASVQILVNLVANARDATGGTGSVGISTGATSDDVVVQVSDDGPGIAAASLDRIFDPFYTTKVGAQGTGLGLAIVQRLVEAAGGSIDVESEIGAGTTFTIRIPRIRDDGDTAAAEPSGTRAGHEATIVVIEDQEPVRRFVVRALEDRGYRVIAAARAEEALILIENLEVPIDLLLTDVVLPGTSGTDIAVTAAALRPGLAVLFISGYPGDEPSDADLDVPSSFLAKPFTSTQLAEAVERLLTRVVP